MDQSKCCQYKTLPISKDDTTYKTPHLSYKINGNPNICRFLTVAVHCKCDKRSRNNLVSKASNRRSNERRNIPDSIFRVLELNTPDQYPYNDSSEPNIGEP